MSHNNILYHHNAVLETLHDCCHHHLNQTCENSIFCDYINFFPTANGYTLQQIDAVNKLIAKMVAIFQVKDKTKILLEMIPS